MRLYHYSEKPFTFDASRRYEHKHLFKPSGFWFSVGDAWKLWCESEDFITHTLKIKTAFDVDVSDMLIIKDKESLDLFKQNYPLDSVTYNTPWHLVKKTYKGLFISPYHHSLRFERDAIWYDTADCASACVWDLSTVVLIETVEDALL